MIDCSANSRERQVTTALQDHVLTNINVWSGDGEWLVYDIRSGDGTGFNGNRIEMVNVHDGSVRLLYQSERGACCGVVTFSPADDMVAFILGPENPDSTWDYSFSRRRGLLVDIGNPGAGRSLDAMNYAPPFAPGALRGGSHVHVFSADGKMISFTYDDEILSRLDKLDEKKTAEMRGGHEQNQRNVGVAIMNRPVRVNRNHPRNNDGTCFSVLVTRTVNQPRPGSDEISRAFEEGWIGDNGYLRPDGTRQLRALAFQGLVTAADGRTHAEVFVADLPEDLTPAKAKSLGGDSTHRPAPPKGVVQRRLTYTDNEKNPGVCPAPRHWLRSSPDGATIAFLMKDRNGVVQVWTISPNGGKPRQVTHLTTGIESAVSWSPDNARLAAVADGSVCTIDMQTGSVCRLTPKGGPEHAPSAAACVFSPDGSKIAYLRKVDAGNAVYGQIFTVDVKNGCAAGE